MCMATVIEGLLPVGRYTRETNAGLIDRRKSIDLSFAKI